MAAGLAEIVTVGSGTTVMVTVPDWGWEQLGVPEEPLQHKYLLLLLYLIHLVRLFEMSRH
jgi:hypothetical protein